MDSRRGAALVAAVVSILVAGVAATAAAQEASQASRFEVSLLGGIQALNKNDTALPDHFVDIPAVAAVAYQLNPLLAVEGDLSWMIPVQQKVDLGTGIKQDRKTPDILAYQASLRAGWPQATWTPYLAAGAGAVTFLKNTDADRLPQLGKSETAFAINFGAGSSIALAPHWSVRGDFRELAAFPSTSASGLSTGGKADPIWMERVTLGLGYRM